MSVEEGLAAIGTAPEILTHRTPDEILSLQFDNGDIMLADRMLAEGETLALLGVGGIGKSRITLQLAAAQIMGRPFLTLTTHGKARKWLIIQTENSNRRLQDDLRRLKEWCGDDWPLVQANLVIHTIEKEEDSLLQLEDPEAVARLEKLIAKVNPDVVVTGAKAITLLEAEAILKKESTENDYFLWEEGSGPTSNDISWKREGFQAMLTSDCFTILNVAGWTEASVLLDKDRAAKATSGL